MNRRRVVPRVVIGALAALAIASVSQAQLYNTAKQKLLDGKQIFGGTVSSPDVDTYCAMANAGFDFLWIEMQHSALTYRDVKEMIWACRGAAAMPFIRVPDATEGDIQKAVDIGALGIIVPMVTTAAKMEAAVKFAKYPPEGIRSQGGGQYGALWGRTYRATANDNILVIAMIEQPEGVEAAAQIAAVEGVDVVFAASTDLRSFSGLNQGEPGYEAMITKIHAATREAGLVMGGPMAWSDREGFQFFQAPGSGSLIRRGARAVLEGARSNVAPIEGSERR